MIELEGSAAEPEKITSMPVCGTMTEAAEEWQRAEGTMRTGVLDV